MTIFWGLVNDGLVFLLFCMCLGSVILLSAIGDVAGGSQVSGRKRRGTFQLLLFFLLFFPCFT